MLTRELEETLSFAVDQAVKHKHEFVTLEHLLFALLEDRSAYEILFNCGAQIEEIARALQEYFDNVLEKMPANAEPDAGTDVDLSVDDPVCGSPGRGQRPVGCRRRKYSRRRYTRPNRATLFTCFCSRA